MRLAHHPLAIGRQFLAVTEGIDSDGIVEHDLYPPLPRRAQHCVGDCLERLRAPNAEPQASALTS